MNEKQIAEFVEEMLGDNEEVIYQIDGHASACLGLSVSAFDGHQALVYSEDKIIENLIANESMSVEEAWEHYSFNILGAYIGPSTPIFIRPFSD